MDDEPLSALGLPRRLQQALARAGYFTVGQLRPMAQERALPRPTYLRCIRGVGTKGEVQILDALRHHAQPERPTAAQTAAIKAATPGYGASPDWPEEILAQAFMAGWRAAWETECAP